MNKIKKDKKGHRISYKIKQFRTKNIKLRKVPPRMRFQQKKYEILIFGG